MIKPNVEFDSRRRNHENEQTRLQPTHHRRVSRLANHGARRTPNKPPKYGYFQPLLRALIGFIEAGGGQPHIFSYNQDIGQLKGDSDQASSTA